MPSYFFYNVPTGAGIHMIRLSKVLWCDGGAVGTTVTARRITMAEWHSGEKEHDAYSCIAVNLP